MALNIQPITILNQLTPSNAATGVLVASGGVSTIAVGTPTKAVDAVNASPWTGVVAPMVDGDGTTTQRFTGVAKSTSTNTVAAAGTVDLWIPLPGYTYACKAKTSSTFDTQAEVDANFGKGVFFDLTSTVWTVDVAAAAAQANCVMIVGGDFRTQTVNFIYKPSGTFLGSSISA